MMFSNVYLRFAINHAELALSRGALKAGAAARRRSVAGILKMCSSYVVLIEAATIILRCT